MCRRRIRKMTRILVIDDDVQICNMLERFLSRKGYEVDIAYDGNQGITKFDKARTDLVITDLVMPEKEGIETVMELRAKSPAVKIIAISGGGRVGPESYLEIARELGAQRTFEKPVDFEELLGAVEELTSPKA
ncbi:MAG: response regulator [Deltaproteobacteria bacterium]|nr:response regulator [Deltaproteobacteria bacterium]MBN2671785.1 response regulator [Deltaproteobacteria bacterium]